MRRESGIYQKKGIEKIWLWQKAKRGIFEYRCSLQKGDMRIASQHHGQFVKTPSALPHIAPYTYEGEMMPIPSPPHLREKSIEVECQSCI